VLAVGNAVFAPATASGGPLSPLILAFGIAGTAGNLTAGRAADRRGPGVRRHPVAGR
jgi:predicted MFS family arabinose efflux permease